MLNRHRQFGPKKLPRREPPRHRYGLDIRNWSAARRAATRSPPSGGSALFFRPCITRSHARRATSWHFKPQRAGAFPGGAEPPPTPKFPKVGLPMGPPAFTAMSKFGILAACFLCNGANDTFRIVRLHPVRIAHQARLREGLAAAGGARFPSPFPPLMGNLRPVWRVSSAFLRFG